MAEDTDLRLRDAFVYQVFVRNHTRAGTLAALIEDLDRIRGLGVDILYLLPVHPIGLARRKGSIGSPYAVRDYFSIHPELGTLDDFRRLIKETHRHGMRLMMDMVFNHAAPDAVIARSRPDFFHTDAEGRLYNRTGGWSDVADFKLHRKDVQDYLASVLAFWDGLGVDGFRFDVASLLPKDFLRLARARVKAQNPQTIWLSESVHEEFLREVRRKEGRGLSEAEIFETFDLSYDYDSQPAFSDYLKGSGTLADYAAALNRQEATLPMEYIKLRNLENHDFGRVAEWLDGDLYRLKNWLAFSFFAKGATMVYAGGEWAERKQPDLFEKDPVAADGPDLSRFIGRWSQAVRGEPFRKGAFHVEAIGGTLFAKYDAPSGAVVGAFDVAGEGTPRLPVAFDGEHVDAILEKRVSIANGRTSASGPLMFHP